MTTETNTYEINTYEINTMQEVLDKVVPLLRTQGCRSMAEPSPIGGAVCAYRGEGGTKCLVGHLIKDEFFDERFNTQGVMSTPEVKNALELSGVNPTLFNELHFIQEFLHDALPDIDFSETFEQVVTTFCREEELIIP